MLLLITGCDNSEKEPINSLNTQIESQPIKVHVEPGVIHIKGPFRKEGDYFSIHSPYIYEDTAPYGLAVGESAPASFNWNGNPFSIISEYIYSYDYAFFKGTCLNKSNNSMSLIFSGNYGGTGNAGRPSDLMFFHYDQKTQSVAVHEVSEELYIEGGCLDAIEASEALLKKVKGAEKELAKSLYQSADEETYRQNKDAYPLTKLEFDPSQLIKAHYEEYKEYYENQYCQLSEEQGKPNNCLNDSIFSLIAKHPSYEIYRLEFYHYGESIGIDLLRYLRKNYWYHLYTIPTGGSKHQLFYPYYEVLTPNKISFELCTNCSWWGDWHPYELYIPDLPAGPIKKVIP